MSLADDSYRFASTYEGELLLELMLRFWNHPLAGDSEFRNDLLEVATQIILDSIDGANFVAELSPHQMNLVAAIWLAESETLSGDSELSADEKQLRQRWLETVKRTLPACFCNPDDLSP